MAEWDGKKSNVIFLSRVTVPHEERVQFPFLRGSLPCCDLDWQKAKTAAPMEVPRIIVSGDGSRSEARLHKFYTFTLGVMECAVDIEINNVCRNVQ